LEWYYEAFGKLTTCRSVGMGPGPIPWTAVREYCAYHGLDEDDQAEFEYLISVMDDAYLEYAAEQAKKDQEGSSPRKPLTANSKRR
jgi:hypothetical protein